MRLAPQHTWCTWTAPETGVTLGCPWSSLSLWWAAARIGPDGSGSSVGSHYLSVAAVALLLLPGELVALGQGCVWSELAGAKVRLLPH